MSAALSLVALALRCIYTPHALHIYSCYYMMRPYNTPIYTALYILYIHPYIYPSIYRLYIALYTPVFMGLISSLLYRPYFRAYIEPLYTRPCFLPCFEKAQIFGIKTADKQVFCYPLPFLKIANLKNRIAFSNQAFIFSEFFPQKISEFIFRELAPTLVFWPPVLYVCIIFTLVFCRHALYALVRKKNFQSIPVPLVYLRPRHRYFRRNRSPGL